VTVTLHRRGLRNRAPQPLRLLSAHPTAERRKQSGSASTAASVGVQSLCATLHPLTVLRPGSLGSAHTAPNRPSRRRRGARLHRPQLLLGVLDGLEHAPRLVVLVLRAECRQQRPAARSAPCGAAGPCTWSWFYARRQAHCMPAVPARTVVPAARQEHMRKSVQRCAARPRPEAAHRFRGCMSGFMAAGGGAATGGGAAGAGAAGCGSSAAAGCCGASAGAAARSGGGGGSGGGGSARGGALAAAIIACRPARC